MIKEGKYIYSIIQENENRSFGPIGINNREVKLVPYKPSTRAKLGAGLVPHRNEVSGAGDIAAVVSSTPIINFDRLDKKELTKHIATHQKVNEEIMKDYDLVPMAFGIIAPSVKEVLRILEKVYLQFKTALKNVTGKAEFVVQVWWNPQKILEELVNTNLEIQKLRKEMSLKGNILGMPINPVRGQRSLVERQGEQTSNGVKLKLGKLIQEGMETKRQTFIKDIQQILDNLVQDFSQNKLRDENMLVNFSFLIEKLREPELDNKMQGLGEKYDGKLRFKYIGPMPAYSFVNINLGLGNFELIDGARKLLGLPEVAIFEQIKKTYYELSHQYHPDRFGGDETKMKKIVQAYCILENYCRSCDGFEGKKRDEKYSFKKEDVENSLIIR